jgi:MFS family permease
VTTKRRRIVIAAVSVALAILFVVVLADHLGKLRWFWPYDGEVFAILLLLGPICAYALQRATAPILEEYQARIDREDNEYK